MAEQSRGLTVLLSMFAMMLACVATVPSAVVEPSDSPSPAETPAPKLVSEAEPQPRTEPEPETRDDAPRECPKLGCACVVAPKSGDGCPTCDCEETGVW